MIQKAEVIIFDWIDRFLVPIDDPTSRLFYLNVVFAVVFIFAWLFIVHKKRMLKNKLADITKGNVSVDYKMKFLR